MGWSEALGGLVLLLMAFAAGRMTVSRRVPIEGPRGQVGKEPPSGSQESRTSLQALGDLLRAGAMATGSDSLDLFRWKEGKGPDHIPGLFPLASSSDGSKAPVALDEALSRRFLREREDLYLPEGLTLGNRSRTKSGSLYFSRVGYPHADALGLLVSRHPDRDAYGVESRGLLLGLARVCGDLIRAEDTRSGLEQDRTALTTALKIGKGLTSSLEVDEVMRETLGALLNLTGAATGFFVLFSKNESHIESVVPVGCESRAVKEALAKPEVMALIERILRKGEIMLVDSAASGGRLPAALSKALGVSPERVLMVPLRNEASAIGLLKLDGYSRDCFSPTEIRIVTLLSDLLTMALQNAGLHLDLARQAERDLLTGLYNRQGFILRSRPMLEKTFSESESLSIALVDLDHFKKVNDSWGHGEGDRVLKAVSQCLLDSLDRGPLIGRWGGEEFIIVFPGMKTKKAADKLRQAGKRLSQRVQAGRGDKAWPMTMSGGVAGLGQAGQSLDQLTEAADRALYRAKENGRNRIEISNE